MENKISKEEMEKIKEALYSTASRYSIKQAKGALKDLILQDDIDYFTRSDNARNNIREIGIEKVKDIAITKYIDFIINHPSAYENPLEEAIRRTYFKYKNNPKVDEIKLIKDLLKDCIEKEKNTFTRDSDARANLNDYLSRNNIKLSEFVAKSISGIVTEDLILEKIENIVEKNELKISNVETYPNNLNQVRSAIISGTRLKREGTIALGQDLQACSSIGNIRKNQEDAVLLIRHPKNSDFKMMVVADGVGGLDVGEEASNRVVTDMQSWFECLDISYFENIDGIEENLGQALQIISNELYKKYRGRAGSTFVGAIIGKNETLISNVGDSRAYTISGTDLQQITEDHSYVNNLYKQGKIRNSDDMRFHTRNNQITQCMGKGIIQPNFYTLRNVNYDSILLLSDGVTDCLSDVDILAITKYTDRKMLAKTLVESALKYDSIRPRHLDSNPDYKEKIVAGKDNATAAVYINPQKKDGIQMQLENNISGDPRNPGGTGGAANPNICPPRKKEKQPQSPKEDQGLPGILYNEEKEI